MIVLINGRLLQRHVQCVELPLETDIVYEANNGYEVNLSPTLRLNPKQKGEQFIA